MKYKLNDIAINNSNSKKYRIIGIEQYTRIDIMYRVEVVYDGRIFSVSSDNFDDLTYLDKTEQRLKKLERILNGD